MAFELHFTRRAARDVHRIADWWLINRPAVPGAVREDLEAALGLLLEQPGLGVPVPGASAPGVRRFHIDRIRYWVYYRVQGSRLEVLALWHSSRGIGPAV